MTPALDKLIQECETKAAEATKILDKNLMNKKYLILDFETRSEADLKKVGAWEYACHPTTKIICAAWRLGTREELKWQMESKSGGYNHLNVTGRNCFSNLKRALHLTDFVCSHNALFEQVISKFKLEVEIAPEKWICTASLASALALPRSLEGACTALNLPIKKDMEGRRLMLKYSKPRKPTKADPDSKWHNDPEELERIYKYCQTDVDAETLLFLKLPELNPMERKVWCLDQRINMRGVRVDRPLVKSAIKLIEQEKISIDLDTSAITNNYLGSTSQVALTLGWLKDNGLHLPDLTVKTVSEALKTATGKTKQILEFRKAISKTSTAKYQAFEIRSRSDGRVRDNLIYHSASTGRWGGSGVQLQNLPRGTIPDTITASEIVREGDPDLVKLIYGNPMEVYSSCLRSVIISSEGKELFCADYAAIEARVLFWIAEHEEGIKAFREDRPIYEEMASHIYRRKITKEDKLERQVGKQAVLGCLAKNTLIFTDRGWKKIEKVSITDKVWGGKEWVNHSGLVPKGLKNVINIKSLDLELTHNHWVQCQNTWRSAGEIGLNEDIQHQLLEKSMEHGLSSVTRKEPVPNVVSCVAAYVELRKNLGLILCTKEYQELVLLALSLCADKKVVTSLDQLAIFYLTKGLERVGKRVSTTSENVVKIRKTKTTKIMAVAGFDVPSNPLEILWNTLLHLTGLTSGVYHWIELEMTATIPLEIYVSSLKQLTTRIVETYDLVNAGVENRFRAGKAMVHNCGYGMGHKKFKITCENYNILIDEEMAKTAVDTYRKAHYPVKKLWQDLERAAVLAAESKKTIKINNTFWWVDQKILWCKLPSGRNLAYYQPGIQYEDTPWGYRRPKLYHWEMNSVTHKWERSSTYGGKLTENVVQAIARDLMAEAMLRIEDAGYEVILTVHDETLSEKIIGEGSLEEYISLMVELPSWATGLPIKAEGWVGERYKK